ncbi:MAG: hypothetical protein F6K35_42790 [Okeania sp. SIO2H7]|nr:hypothetical protein [Okeania sp. SIO2H7]
MAIQLGLIGNQTFGEIWVYYKQVALGSAVISSLWLLLFIFLSVNCGNFKITK